MLQQPIELVAEGGILARGVIAGGELLDWRDERFRNEASAVRAEVSACVGVATPEHGTIDGCRLGSLRHWYSSNARRAFAMKCVTLSKSFTPGADSTPDDTSTPKGRTARIALATLSGVRPPASTTRRFCAIPAACVQSTTAPVPPRRTGSMLSSSSVVSSGHASLASPS